ncbi:MAG: hypothetical protein VCB99_06850 [Myxococcota bacterium]
MRSFQVFASMTPERAVSMLRNLSQSVPAVFREAVDAAALSSKTRPVYLRRQPFERRAETVRRALSQVASNSMADEMLAVYFLECRKELLMEWLDFAGLAHEDGTLEEDMPGQPDEAVLGEAVTKFLGDDDPDRPLLLRSFAAQQAIDWPALDALLDADS